MPLLRQVYLAVCVPLSTEVAVKLVDMEKLERAEEAAGGLVSISCGSALSGTELCQAAQRTTGPSHASFCRVSPRRCGDLLLRSPVFQLSRDQQDFNTLLPAANYTVRALCCARRPAFQPL